MKFNSEKEVKLLISSAPKQKIENPSSLRTDSSVFSKGKIKNIDDRMSLSNSGFSESHQFTQASHYSMHEAIRDTNHYSETTGKLRMSLGYPEKFKMRNTRASDFYGSPLT